MSRFAIIFVPTAKGRGRGLLTRLTARYPAIDVP